MSTISIPAEYGLVGAAIFSTGLLNIWQARKVRKARFAAKINYPQMYAEKAEAESSMEAKKFNCVQRAHQNTLESLPNMLAGAAYFGLVYPKMAAASLITWVIGRIIYTVGYASGQPMKRLTGFYVSGLPSFVVLLGSGAVAFQSVRALLI